MVMVTKDSPVVAPCTSAPRTSAPRTSANGRTEQGFDASHPPVSNRDIAQQLQSMAGLLTEQKADYWRIQAYRQAAQALITLSESVQNIYLKDGIEGLVRLPHIGKGIAGVIVEILQTGHWSQLERLRGQLDPVWLFSQIPGIGEELAERIVNQHDIDNLEGLESAAYDGRLARVRGIGIKRLEGIRASLKHRLRARTGDTYVHYPTTQQKHHPTVAQLLSVDREYRKKSDDGVLDLIAPRRFNPQGIASLPILHTTRGDWHVTALFSNTDRAHALRKTRDWVVLYFHSDQHQEGQYTVVTEVRGPLNGKRVIRGLDAECLDYYKEQALHVVKDQHTDQQQHKEKNTV